MFTDQLPLRWEEPYYARVLMFRLRALGQSTVAASCSMAERIVHEVLTLLLLPPVRRDGPHFDLNGGTYCNRAAAVEMKIQLGE